MWSWQVVWYMVHLLSSRCILDKAPHPFISPHHHPHHCATALAPLHHQQSTTATIDACVNRLAAMMDHPHRIFPLSCKFCHTMLYHERTYTQPRRLSPRKIRCRPQPLQQHRWSHDAAHSGEIRKTRDLGVDPNVEDNQGQTPLELRAFSGGGFWLVARGGSGASSWGWFSRGRRRLFLEGGVSVADLVRGGVEDWKWRLSLRQQSTVRRWCWLKMVVRLWRVTGNGEELFGEDEGDTVTCY